MNLRDHPMMKHHGAPNWPPAILTHEFRQERIEEFGIVTHISADPRDPRKCFLMLEFDRLGYASCLQFDDQRFCLRFIDTIKGHLNKSIREIGELDVSIP